MFKVLLNQHYQYKKYYEYHTIQTIECISADKSKSTKKQKEEIEVKLEWIDEKLKDLYWFDAEVFKLYYRKNFSLSEMAKATKINKNTLYKAIRNVKNYLKNEL